MYRVEYRHPGGHWINSQLPTTLQVASGFARAVKELQRLEEVRIEAQDARPTVPTRLVDILV